MVGPTRIDCPAAGRLWNVQRVGRLADKMSGRRKEGDFVMGRASRGWTGAAFIRGENARLFLFERLDFYQTGREVEII